MKIPRNKLVGFAAATAAAALLLSGCSASGSDSSSEGGEQASGELTQVTLAINPSSQSAPLYYGLQEGIFADHGIDLEIVPQTDVAAIVSGVASGQYDFGFGTVVHVINANLGGIPLRAVATVEGQQKDHEEPEEGNALVAAPGSGVTSAGDLEGKTLAVVGLASLNTFAAYNLIDNAGGDPSQVELVQLPFGQMPAALSSGDVDAAVIQAPFIGEATALGGTIIGKPNVETFPNMAVGLYTTTQSFIDQNEDVVKAFSDAVVASQLAASENVDGARMTLVENLGITEEAAMAALWNTDSNPYVNVEGFETAQDLLIRFGDQTEELDVNELVWPGALE